MAYYQGMWIADEDLAAMLGVSGASWNPQPKYVGNNPWGAVSKEDADANPDQYRNPFGGNQREGGKVMEKDVLANPNQYRNPLSTLGLSKYLPKKPTSFVMPRNPLGVM